MMSREWGSPSPGQPPEQASTHAEQPKTLSPEEFEQLLKPIMADAYRLAIRILGPERASHAEDVVQQAITKAFERRHLFKTSTNFKNWILTIIANDSRTFHRYSNPRSHASLDQANEDGHILPIFTEGPASTVEDVLGDLQEHRRIQEAMKRVNPEWIKTFTLVYLEGLTYEEAAEQLNVKVGTVMSRLHRARKAILAALQEHTPDVVAYHNDRRKRTALEEAPTKFFKTNS